MSLLFKSKSPPKEGLVSDTTFIAPINPPRAVIVPVAAIVPVAEILPVPVIFLLFKWRF